MRDYPPYKKDSTCKMCGQVGATTKYEEAARYTKRETGYPEDYLVPAHMRRKCVNCGYQWSEAPLGV